MQNPLINVRFQVTRRHGSSMLYCHLTRFENCHFTEKLVSFQIILIKFLFPQILLCYCLYLAGQSIIGFYFATPLKFRVDVAPPLHLVRSCSRSWCNGIYFATLLMLTYSCVLTYFLLGYCACLLAQL